MNKMSKIKGTDIKFNPIELEVFSNRLQSITDEMALSLIKSSFSTNIKERKDCSVGLFDAKPRLIAQASNIPLHLGSLVGGVEAVFKGFKLEDIYEGDAFICNDPYLAGGTHTPDISIISPIFIEGELQFFAANIGHHTDVGGPHAGSTGPTMTSIFSEGLRIPVIKIARKGEIDLPLLNLISQNSRDPQERNLDLRVQIATNEIGRISLTNLVKREGILKTKQVLDGLIDYTQRRLCKSIQVLDNGSYSGEAWLDHDGLGGKKRKIFVTVTINDDRIEFDFEGTDTQARGGINVPESALNATCYYAVKSMIDPELPPNSGLFEAVSIKAPLGCLVNPKFPGATGSRSSTCQKVTRAIFQAFENILPEEKVIAPSCDMNGALVFSGPRLNGEGQFVYLETVAGGGGACLERDGMDGVQVHITNTSNLPAEAMELEYPLIVKQYALDVTSCGAGRTRGGAGIIRDIEASCDDITASVRTEGMVTPALGIKGGDDGGQGKIALLSKDGITAYQKHGMAEIPLKKGEGVRLVTPGGAGFGPIEQRAAYQCEVDQRDGYLIEVQEC